MYLREAANFVECRYVASFFSFYIAKLARFVQWDTVTQWHPTFSLILHSYMISLRRLRREKHLRFSNSWSRLLYLIIKSIKPNQNLTGGRVIESCDDLRWFLYIGQQFFVLLLLRSTMSVAKNIILIWNSTVLCFISAREQYSGFDVIFIVIYFDIVTFFHASAAQSFIFSTH